MSKFMSSMVGLKKKKKIKSQLFKFAKYAMLSLCNKNMQIAEQLQKIEIKDSLL